MLLLLVVEVRYRSLEAVSGDLFGQGIDWLDPLSLCLVRLGLGLLAALESGCGTSVARKLHQLRAWDPLELAMAFDDLIFGRSARLRVFQQLFVCHLRYLGQIACLLRLRDLFRCRSCALVGTARGRGRTDALLLVELVTTLCEGMPRLLGGRVELHALLWYLTADKVVLLDR